MQGIITSVFQLPVPQMSHCIGKQFRNTGQI